MNDLFVGRPMFHLCLRDAAVVAGLFALAVVATLTADPEATPTIRTGLLLGIGVAFLCNLLHAIGPVKRGFGVIDGFSEYQKLIKQTEDLVSSTWPRAATAHLVLSVVYGPLFVAGFFVSLNWVLLGIFLGVLDSYLSFKLFQPPRLILVCPNAPPRARDLRLIRRSLKPHRVITLTKHSRVGDGTTALAVESAWLTVLEMASQLSPDVVTLSDDMPSAVPPDIAHDSEHVVMMAAPPIGQSPARGAPKMTLNALLSRIRSEGWGRQALVGLPRNDASNPEALLIDSSSSSTT
jgi:hypothetical protein